jgi:phosphatidylserine/phosphatidylglycerophosphate/cardiolipin synthase-like enzyme
MSEPAPLSHRTRFREARADAWSLIWDAGPYYAKVARALETARRHAVLVGWQLDSRLRLRVGADEPFIDLLRRVCREKPELHVYLLMWDHAYFYVFERELLQSRTWDDVHERIHFVFDNRHPYGASHHEKIVIVDGETAFTGGVDICDDRWDSPWHAYDDRRRSLKHDGERHLPYHDVVAEIHGEAAGAILEHVGERWRRVSAVPFPRAPTARGSGRFRVLLSRTQAAPGVTSPLLIRENEFLFRELIRAARFQLVIENQYYWSEEVNEELIALLRARAGTGFRLFLVVPSAYGGSMAFRLMGPVQTRLLARLGNVARETGTHFDFGCPFSISADGRMEKSVYVHSKVIAVDDAYLAVGSANFNNRGMRLDSELTVTLAGDTPEARARIRLTAARIMAHWSGRVYLKSYFESWAWYLRSPQGRFAARIPLKRFFDPPIPIGYLFKARLARVSGEVARRARVIFLWGALQLLVGASFLLAGAVMGTGRFAGGVPAPYALACAIAFGVSFVLPVPTILAAALTGAQLGAVPGAVIVFWSLLTAMSAGYWLSRLLPGLSMRLSLLASPDWLGWRIGNRAAIPLLGAMLAPIEGLSSKVAWQGAYAIPFRWFFPGALLTASAHAGLAFLAARFEPPWPLAGQFGVCMACLVAITIIRCVRRGSAIQSHLLQHPQRVHGR